MSTIFKSTQDISTSLKLLDSAGLDNPKYGMNKKSSILNTLLKNRGLGKIGEGD